jgi:hypothetical protein
MTTFPFPSLIQLIGLSEPWFPPYRLVKRGFTVYKMHHMGFEILMAVKITGMNDNETSFY